MSLTVSGPHQFAIVCHVCLCENTLPVIVSTKMGQTKQVCTRSSEPHRSEPPTSVNRGTVKVAWAREATRQVNHLIIELN